MIYLKIYVQTYILMGSVYLISRGMKPTVLYPPYPPYRTVGFIPLEIR